MKKVITNIFIPLMLTLILALTTDCFFGTVLLEKIALSERELRYHTAPHQIFSHTLAANFDGIATWGPKKYRVCTNQAGFKEDCGKSGNLNKNIDIAFIGDSFTEGVGLTYEETFVGQIAAALPELKISNLGVSSYSPSLYLAKIKYLLESGFRFKEIIVYIDISDIHDEAVVYETHNGRVVNIDNKIPNENVKPKDARTIVSYLKETARNLFPLSYNGLHVVKESIKGFKRDITEDAVDIYNIKRSAWTYDLNSDGYGAMGVKGGIEKSISIMAELHTLLDKEGIQLSVGVYPWPAQLLHGAEQSIQVQIWREFCSLRCKTFYNSFPAYFAKRDKYGLTETIETFFINGDVHHSFLGSQIIAQDFLKMR